MPIIETASFRIRMEADLKLRCIYLEHESFGSCELRASPSLSSCGQKQTVLADGRIDEGPHRFCGVNQTSCGIAAKLCA